jgi:fatty acid desaturase
MDTDDRSRRRRELVTVSALALLAGTGLFFFVLLITGGLLIAVLGALVAMALVGWLHYTLWGRELAREVRRKDDRIPPPRRR